MSQRRIFILLALMLMAGTFWLYAPSLHHDFVNYDDTAYVTLNPHVQAGLTPASVGWAFTTFDTGNWHPLTWLSHELDCQLYGLNPTGHHLTGILFHVANAFLLFNLLRRMTRALWCSAIVAAFFAWHPLRVESVAWVAERKDVLSTFFGLLSLNAYVSYVFAKIPPIKNLNRPTLFFMLAWVCFALSLMSKGMWVTLPFILLLLDYWPLRRIADPQFQTSASSALPLPQISLLDLIREKVPFLVLSLAGCVITFVAQRAGGNLWSGSPLPLKLRVTTALVACFRYTERTFLPTHLCVFYPYMAWWPTSLVLISIMMIVVLFVNAQRGRVTHPYLMVGWLWFLGTLVPVIGLVQVGYQAMADRYTYIPGIGLLIMVVWEVEDFTRKWPRRNLLVGLAAAGLASTCLAMTRAQEKTWTNSETLFRQALKATADNHIARTGLGLALYDQGRIAESMVEYEAAIKIFPDYYYAQYGLGNCLLAQQKWAAAAERYQRTIAIFQKSPEPYAKLGVALAQQGKRQEAAQAFSQSLQLDSHFPLALYQLAWLRATTADPSLRDATEALRLAKLANTVAPRDKDRIPGALDAAYAAAKLFPEAIAAAQSVEQSALNSGNKTEADAAAQRLELYRAGKAIAK